MELPPRPATLRRGHAAGRNLKRRSNLFPPVRLRTGPVRPAGPRSARISSSLAAR
ncbi:hypothetical protein PSMK_15790 [Phycisphaera mikurensis NBRC 102666]|uniref:Uncharacterized protein n=1 Tax=Phycisphaera mikurensis (strain NBRC 102666 / KCTC 22515 / FYK2301M01) TaxID=1142394 RepID=I0IEQ0_PHYMF|nr:hypothetical protein PSMK_15790 [Phycisphaera mikurensis NBRC 102666]